MKPLLIIITLLLLPFSISLYAQEGITEIISIEDRSATAPITQSVRDSVSVVRGTKDPASLPELKFYKYRLKKNDTFWKILSRTTLNVDTVMTVNNLSSPHDLKPGDTVYLPSMRGVIHECVKGERIEDIESRYAINRDYIFAANKIQALTKKYIFIPCGEVTSLERGLFIGTGFAAPLEKLRRTSGFGMRRDPFTGDMSFHTGVDLGCPVSTPVFAARSGKVVFTGFKGDYGLLVIIEHPCGYFSYYGHLSRILVRPGITVNEHTRIALSGNTGRTTGPHLHFEIRKNERPVNPNILLR
jgi:murein DD-endopeptidase MepM/ murein hydrolase activator NlpD